MVREEVPRGGPLNRREWADGEAQGHVLLCSAVIMAGWGLAVTALRMHFVLRFNVCSL